MNFLQTGNLLCNPYNISPISNVTMPNKKFVNASRCSGEAGDNTINNATNTATPKIIKIKIRVFVLNRNCTSSDNNSERSILRYNDSPTNHNPQHNLVTNEMRHKTIRMRGGLPFYSVSIKMVCPLFQAKSMC